ncbi:MAG TPA: hypothetical protein PKU81_07095 [Bacteroidales bacterium]|nr:hypothetical protein [Bacteroidales bacterium]HQD35231.1 hypothetical protein [Bacteroidales bacterium]
MKTKTLIILFGISIGLNIALLIIIIYDHSKINKLEKQSQTNEWKFPKHGKHRPLFDDLQLSPEQELDMKNEMHLYRSHIKIFADSMNIIRDSLFRQLNRDNPDTIIINKYIDSLVHFDRKMHQELVKHLTVVKSILDKEQYNIFLENMKNKFKPHCKPNNKKYKSYEKINEYFNDVHHCYGKLSFDGTEKSSTIYSTPSSYYFTSSRATTKSLWMAKNS